MSCEQKRSLAEVQKEMESELAKKIGRGKLLKRQLAAFKAVLESVKTSLKAAGFPIGKLLVGRNEESETLAQQPTELEPLSKVAAPGLEIALQSQHSPTLNILRGQHGALPAEVVAEAMEPVPERRACRGECRTLTGHDNASVGQVRTFNQKWVQYVRGACKGVLPRCEG